MSMLGLPAVLLALLLVIDDKPADIDYEAKLNGLLSKDITPETNANVLIWKAFGPSPEGGSGMSPEFFKRLGIPVPPKEGDYFIGLTRFMRDRLKLNPDDWTVPNEQQVWATKQPWDAREYPHIAAWLAANEKPLAIVIEATKRPSYYNPLVAPVSGKERGMLLGALTPGVQTCRELAAALTARAMLRVKEGKSDEAWQDLLAAHRLGRLVTHGGSLIESLVGIAIGTIAYNSTLAYLDRVKLTTKQVARHLKDLNDLPPRRAMADTIDIGERHLGLDSFQHIRHGGGNLLPGKEKATEEDLKALEMIDWDAALAIVTSSYDRMAAALRMPDRATRAEAFDKLEMDLEAQAKQARKDKEVLKKQPAGAEVGKIVAREIANVLMGLLAPAFRKVQDAYDRAEQIDRNLHIAFALAAYRADNGRYPAKLADLAPKYLAAVPGDLFAGKPLIYKPTEKGYLVYSIGPNGKDEGGRWNDDMPPGDDPRVRMPLPEKKKDK